MKQIIKNRFDGSVIYEGDHDTLQDAVIAAIANRTSLSSADLSSADLSYADLNSADLRYADLNSADLSYADLSSADLSSASLRSAKNDFFVALLNAVNEVNGLRTALIDGKVDGSKYEGECACLVGTIANVAHCNYQNLPLLKPDGSRPSERWFLGIKKGDTPKNSQIVKITVEWVDEFLDRINRYNPVHAAMGEGK